MRKIYDGLTNQQRHYLRNKDNPEYIARKASAQKKLVDNGWRAEYNAKNRGTLNANEGKRRAAKKNQTPDMNSGELAEIEGFYLYNQVMEGKWHVDHIDPIDNGGLHHPLNLQILSQHDNQTKSAKI